MVYPLKLSLQVYQFGFDLESEINDDLVASFVKHLSSVFGGEISIHIRVFRQLPPAHLFNNHRRRWVSDRILDWLLREYDPDVNTKILAMCNFDAYSNGLNFVFGQAHIEGKVATIYLPRLREEFYGRNKDDNLFCERMTKEAVHELGHCFGLGHCETSTCVMHFSNSLYDTDAKSNDFCKNCKKLVFEVK